MLLHRYVSGCKNIKRVYVGVSLQSCDSAEYTLQGPAGGHDVTGLSVGPSHYQLLSELGEEDAELP